MKFARIAQKLDQFLHVFLGLIHTRNVGKGGGNLVFAKQSRLALAEAHGAATAAGAALHLAHKEHKHGDDDQDRKTGHKQLGPDALLFGFAAFDLYLVGEQVIHQFGVFDHGARGLEARTVVALAVDGQSIDSDFSDLVALNLLDELRVDHTVGGCLHAEVVEDGQQYRGNHKPKQQVFSHIVQNHHLFNNCNYRRHYNYRPAIAQCAKRCAV